jgi:hypothetical protein
MKELAQSAIEEVPLSSENYAATLRDGHDLLVTVSLVPTVPNESQITGKKQHGKN